MRWLARSYSRPRRRLGRKRKYSVEGHVGECGVDVHVRIARKPPAWCGTKVVILRPRGSTPLGGCTGAFSTGHWSSLDFHVRFAIFALTTLVPCIKWDAIGKSPSARVAVFVVRCR